ncbi:MAG: YdiU family protein [Devosia sp.]|uniref:protein adenylyltransferase SelO n=1 Tax=Devosia sp. TaxID=1871048 RepID=UPI001ACFDB66|nr:YdiU family protein [Devosia sp.]MBN9316671.1 YdiU family protein [Devosia sp.]
MTAFKPRTTHAELGEGYFDKVRPAAFPQTILRYRNQRAAASVGLDGLTEAQWIAHFGRFEPLPGSFAEPLALRYHGHQFQTYNPDLGDGRGFLFAQLEDLNDGRLMDLGTKGSGRTPWSRGGDGRLTLKGGVREVLATAMLEALGVNTSKSLSLIETGEELERGDEPSPTRASVLVRLSHGHTRIGTFQRLSYLKEEERLKRLVDHSVRAYYPELWVEGDNGRAAKFLGAVSEKVAETGANWIAAGFVHGVLNTDNINITGESFDYGPWRFLPTYEPTFTAAYFDESGLYAFGRQPDTLAWNLTRFAEVLLPLGEHAEMEAGLNRFWPAFQRAIWAAVLRRLGLATLGVEADSALVQEVYNFLNETQMGYEQFFFDWRGGDGSRALRSPAAEHYRGAAFETLAGLISAHPRAGDANLDHPYFSRETPRTTLIEEMEALWAPIAERDDWRPLYEALGEIEEMREAYAGE